MKKIFSTVLLVCLIMSLCLLSGCGEKYPADSPIIGIWQANTAEAFGFELPIGDVFEGEFSIQTRTNGKADLVIAGESGTCNFTFEDNTVSFDLGDGNMFVGTLNDTVLIFENVMDSGVTLYFEKLG